MKTKWRGARPGSRRPNGSNSRPPKWPWPLDAALAKKEKDAITAALAQFNSVLDKAAKHGIIKKNTAIRRKRRAAARLKKAGAAPAAK